MQSFEEPLHNAYLLLKWLVTHHTVDLQTWKVPEAPFPVICSKYPFSTDLCRQFLSTSGLRDTQTNLNMSDLMHTWHAQRHRWRTGFFKVNTFCCEGLPALYVELGKMLLQVFLNKNVRSLFGLAEASHDQWQSLAQRPALGSWEAGGGGLLSYRRERDIQRRITKLQPLCAFSFKWFTTTGYSSTEITTITQSVKLLKPIPFLSWNP